MRRLDMDSKVRARLLLMMKALSLGMPLPAPREGKTLLSYIGMDEDGEVWFLAMTFQDGTSEWGPVVPFLFIGEPVTVGFVADLAKGMTEEEAAVLAANVALNETKRG